MISDILVVFGLCFSLLFKRVRRVRVWFVYILPSPDPTYKLDIFGIGLFDLYNKCLSYGSSKQDKKLQQLCP